MPNVLILRKFCVGAILLLFCVDPLLVSGAEMIDLGSRRELFVDQFLIEKMNGTRLQMHQPQREGTALKFDKPWEGGFCSYATVIKEGDSYRMYYRGLPVAGRDGSDNESVCYAESRDGVSWKKPNLGIFTIHGTIENNVVFTNAPYAHNFSPFLDDRPSVEASAKFKALAGTYKTGLHAFVSPDGLRWQALQADAVFTNGVFDSQNVAFWSAHEQQYILYFRTMKKVGNENFRWVSRTTSKDFVTWTKPVEMEFGETPPEHLYTNGTHPYFRAPHIFIGLAKRFFPNKVAVSAEAAKSLVDDPKYRIASSDSILMTTRGGAHFDRTFMEAFIRPGSSPEDWIARDNTPALGVVPANDREMFIYRGSHYAQPSAELTRYSLRIDGFVSVKAPYAGGEMLTRPFKFSGEKLEINFATSAAGGMRIEIQNEEGVAIAGFTSADCPEMIGDDISRIVSWSKGPDVAKLAGKTIRLRFQMKDADLYSIRFL